MKTFLPSIALLIALLLTGCASRKRDEPWHSQHKWYQGDMDGSERSFFIDSFFDNRR